MENRIRPLVSTTAISHSAPGRSVVSQSMTTARWGVSMVRAQVTAWSGRRSHGGASVVVIIGDSSRRAVLGGLEYSGPHRHRSLCAIIMALSAIRRRPTLRHPSRLF